MRKFELTISNGTIAKHKVIVELEDNLTEDEIEQAITEIVFNYVDWSYKEI